MLFVNSPGLLLRPSGAVVLCAALLGLLGATGVVATELSAAQKRHEALMKELVLSPAEEKVFWPLYEAYSAEHLENFNQAAEVSFRLFRSRPKVTDELADEYTETLLKADRRQAEINLSYQPRFRKVLDARKTARFFQFERRLEVFMRAEILKEFPLVQ
jgi:hypothetical protein